MQSKCNMRMNAIAAIALSTGLVACAEQGAESLPSAQEVADAERAFAAYGRANGFNAAMLAHTDPDDGVLLTPDPVGAYATLSQRTNRLGPPYLEWRPWFAAIAQSGDLGMTTGPFFYGGEDPAGCYFTIWRKNAEGVWRWLLDQGCEVSADWDVELEGETWLWPTSTVAPLSRAEALAEIRTAEATLRTAFAEQGSPAYEAALAAGAPIIGFEPQPTFETAPRRAALEARPRFRDFETYGEGASEAGDFGYVYGRAAWTDAEEPRARGAFHAHLAAQRGRLARHCRADRAGRLAGRCARRGLTTVNPA